MSNWISVEDRLPELNVSVIVLMPFGNRIKNDYMVHYSDDTDPIWLNSYQSFVSHWQPQNLPEQNLEGKS